MWYNIMHMCHSLCRQKTMVCHRCVNCHCDNINYFDIDAEVILLVSNTCSQYSYILLTLWWCFLIDTDTRWRSRKSRLVCLPAGRSQKVMSTCMYTQYDFKSCYVFMWNFELYCIAVNEWYRQCLRKLIIQKFNLKVAVYER